jgi:hypothetical protein
VLIVLQRGQEGDEDDASIAYYAAVLHSLVSIWQVSAADQGE